MKYLHVKMEIKCKVCGSENTKKLFKIGTELLKEKNISEIIHCNNCKTNFIKGEISERFLQNFAEKIKGIENTDGLSYDSRIDTIQHYRKLNRLLDFGCGFGGFLKEAVKNKWDAYGQDVSPEAVSYVRDKLKIKNCFLANKELKVNFDVIILWSVIEHLDFPREILRRLLKNLRKGGALIIYCPNASNLFYKLSHIVYYASFKKIDWLMKRVYIPEHRFYFNKESIVYLLKKEGLKIKRIKKKNINLDAIFEIYKNEFWADNFLTKNLIRLLNSMSTSHFEIICEK